MSGVLSLALQPHRHYRRSSIPGLASMPFLGLQGLRKDSGYEIGTGQPLATDMPWHMGTGLTIIAPQSQKPETAAKSPHQTPLPSQSPLAPTMPAMKMAGAPDPAVRSMPERGAGSSSPLWSKQQHPADAEPPAPVVESDILHYRRPGAAEGAAVQSMSPINPLNPHDPLPFKDSWLQANGMVSHPPLAAPGKPNTLPSKEICRLKEKRPDIPFFSQSAIALPKPGTALRPPDAKGQLLHIYPFADMRPDTLLAYRDAVPDPIAGLKPELSSNPSDQDVRFKSHAAAFPQKPASYHTGEPPFLAGLLSDDLPRDFVRTPESNLKVVTEIIEAVVERQVTKKLAAPQATAPICAKSSDSVTRMPSGKGSVADYDQLAHRMIRRINGINRAERFRSGYIR